MLFQLIHTLEIMESELQYRLTPLPDLCNIVARELNGVLKTVFLSLEKELKNRKMADVCSCMNAVVYSLKISNPQISSILLQLGRSLGRYDLAGQLRGLSYLKNICEHKAEHFQNNSIQKNKCYKTLGLCTGIALAIIFI